RIAARTLIAMMAGKAGDARRPAEEALVDRLHHADHLPRPLHPRRHLGEFRAIERRLRHVAERAVIAHRVGEHPHRLEKRVDWNIAEDRHALKDVLRHDRAVACGAWCLRTQRGHGDEARAGDCRGASEDARHFPKSGFWWPPAGPYWLFSWQMFSRISSFAPCSREVNVTVNGF